MTETKQRRLLKTKQAADILSVRPQALRDLVHDEKIPVVILGTGASATWRFDVQDLDRYIASRKQIGV